VFVQNSLDRKAVLQFRLESRQIPSHHVVEANVLVTFFSGGALCAELDLRPFTSLLSLLGTLRSRDLAPVLRRLPRCLESLCLTTEGSEGIWDFDAGEQAKQVHKQPHVGACLEHGCLRRCQGKSCVAMTRRCAPAQRLRRLQGRCLPSSTRRC
jgi:hypothetical protein